MTDQSFTIALFDGDGIGPEITPGACHLIERALTRAGGPAIHWTSCAAGAGTYRDTGHALPKAALDTARTADAIYLAAMGLPDIRHADGREITPQIDLRMELGLFAGVRPVRPIPGVRPVLADPRALDADFVILRESTEGLFSPAGPSERRGPDEARETMVITRGVCSKLFDFAADLARQRNGQRKVTSVDKANVFAAFSLWRDVFDDRLARHPDLVGDYAYVDAFAMTMALKPWTIDVAVTENMFGDILSDLGAALMGGMGYAPSADIGENHAVFQPCHGSAPDIAGRGVANPTAMILSGAMMLDWLAHRHGSEEAKRAGDLLEHAVATAFRAGDLVTCELGGNAGTEAVFDAVGVALDRCDV